MAADVSAIGAEIKFVREIIERGDSEADRRLSAIESRFEEFAKRLTEIEKEKTASIAARDAIEKERSAAAEWWSRVGSWVGIAVTVIMGLIAAAWALFVRAEK